MAERARERQRVREAEERRALEESCHASTHDWHLHGTWVTCPCGAEAGVTCVASEEGWVQPDPCPDCGKPVSGFGNTYPWRHVPLHRLGCREHPDTSRCNYCGQPMIGEMAMTVSADGSSGVYHFGCSPGSRTLDPETGRWRDRTGNVVEAMG